MAKNRIDQVIAKFKEYLETQGLKVERIILYGSHLRSEAKEWSDIDLIVISSGFKRKDFRERLELLGVAAMHILEPIEAIGLTPEEWERGEFPFIEGDC